MLMDINREPLAFCMQCYMCKKCKVDVKGRQSEATCFLYVALRMHVVESEPLASTGNAYKYLGIALHTIIMRRNAHRIARSHGSRFKSLSIVD
jgi:hypothetical protein